MKKQQQEDRGPGARPTKIERHLDANAEAEREHFGDGAAKRKSTAARTTKGGSSPPPNSRKH